MIGIVYGSTLEVACQKLDKMVNEWINTYGAKNIKKICKDSGKYIVTFNNETWYASVPASGERWKRCNIALIDKSIPQETIDEHIKPYVVLKPWTAMGYY